MAPKGEQPSYAWSSLRFEIELLKKGLQISIGDGKTTNLGNDSWLSTKLLPASILRTTTYTQLMVGDIIGGTTGTPGIFYLLLLQDIHSSGFTQMTENILSNLVTS